MSVLELVIAPDQRLKTQSVAVELVDDQVRTLMDDMLETMHKFGGIGLAAVQIGVLKSVLVAHIPEEMGWEYDDQFPKKEGYISSGGPYYMANPRVLQVSKEKVILEEGCLSIPEQRDKVTRPESLIVEYLDRDGEKCVMKAERWLGRCIQHEIDHINGVLFIDHLSKMKLDMSLKKAAKIKKWYTKKN